LDEHGLGICSTRIDFQLGTNGGDANAIAAAMEVHIYTAATISCGEVSRVQGWIQRFSPGNTFQGSDLLRFTGNQHGSGERLRGWPIDLCTLATVVATPLSHTPLTG
jgi:hypothetical protein